MAEVIGTVASIAQLVTLSGQLLAGGYGFLSKVTRAPSEVRSLLTETAAINSLLGQLQILADAGQKLHPDDALQALEQLGVFQECQITLKSVQQALARCEQLHGKDVKNFGRRLIWPFKEKETKDALQQLHRLRGLLANALEANNANTLRRIEAGQGLLMGEVTSLAQDAKLKQEQEETRAIINWVCPLPSDGAQTSLQNALSLKTPGTSNWFFELDVFQKWLQPESMGIWVTGLPGSGKSLLCASIIDRIQHSCDPPKSAIFYFFCDHRDQAKRTLENFLMNITKQMLDCSPACLSKAKELHTEKTKNPGQVFNRSEYLDLIKSFLPDFAEIYFVLDGLDEAVEREQISDALLEFLLSGTRIGVSIKVLFSSRFDIRIQQRESILISKVVALGDNTNQDIEHYTDWELESRVVAGTIKLRDKGLKPIIKKQIVSRAGT